MAKKTVNQNPNDFNTNEIGGASDETFTSPVREEPGEKIAPKKRTLVSGAEFWLFTDELADDNSTVIKKADGSIFEGYFRGIQKREKDGKGENQKAGSVIGYIFEQKNSDGAEYIIGKGHSVEKAIEASGVLNGENLDKCFTFEFLGKGKNADGKPFNKFTISIDE